MTRAATSSVKKIEVSERYAIISEDGLDLLQMRADDDSSMKNVPSIVDDLWRVG
jgi:hypothetical protein